MKRYLAAALFALLFGSSGTHAEEVRIGIIFPLSGTVAQVGLDAVAAARTAAEIINEGADLDLPLAKGKGLPGLGGAKLKLIISDTQGKPEIGLSETERLISQEKVHAVFGAFMSSVSAAASQAAERAGIPFVNGSSSSPALTARGFKYFFRTSPHDEHFSQFIFDFIRDFDSMNGKKLQSISIINEDTAFGADSARVQSRLTSERGLKLSERIAYKAQTTSLSSEVQRLKAADADVLLPSSYTSDSMLLFRTAKELDYNPKLMIAQGAGFVDPTFISSLGRDAEGAITRSPFNLDLAKRMPLISKVNEIFKKHSNGRDLSDVPAREFTAFMTLADAINRAKSTDPEKIRAALAATNIPASELIVPYQGIRFDDAGQNVLVRPILMQVQKGKYCTFYPVELASCKIVYPAPTWDEKEKL